MTTTHTVIDSPLGDLTLVRTPAGLSGIYMSEARHRPDPATFGARRDEGFADAVGQLRGYFAGDRRRFDLELDSGGDGFQRRVWDLLTGIPYGQTRSYGDLAAQLGDPGLARAVGAANGANPLCIVVPCHRVVGADGGLVGYAGGLERKRYLLALEEPAAETAERLF